MAAFLMSEEVQYINGEVIAIDRGMGIMGNGTFANMLAPTCLPTAKTNGAASVSRSRPPTPPTAPSGANDSAAQQDTERSFYCHGPRGCVAGKPHNATIAGHPG